MSPYRPLTGCCCGFGFDCDPWPLLLASFFFGAGTFDPAVTGFLTGSEPVLLVWAGFGCESADEREVLALVSMNLMCAVEPESFH